MKLIAGNLYTVTEAATAPETIICVRHDDGDPFVIQRVARSVTTTSTATITDDGVTLSALDLERILMERMRGKPIRMQNNFHMDEEIIQQQQQETERKVFYRPRRDLSFLKCSGMALFHNLRTILALSEDNQSPHVKINCYQAEYQRRNEIIDNVCHSDDNPQHRQRPRFQRQRGPHSDWKRTPFIEKDVHNYDETNNKLTNMRWIDLRWIEDKCNNEEYYGDDKDTREDENKKNTDSTRPFLSTEAGAVQLLRSILTPSHDASPWVDNSSDPDSLPDIVVLVLKDGSNDNNQKDQASFSLLKDFRVSDVAPSWFMHCYAHMEYLEASSWDLFFPNNNNNDTNNDRDTSSKCSTTSPASLMIYKQLSHRQTHYISNPYGDRIGNYGTLRKTTKIPSKGFLWEEYEENEDDSDSHHQEQNDGVDNNKTTPVNHRHYRLVSPPYLNLEEEYPKHVFAKLFSKDAIRIFTEDALSVPQWIPWPESAHYKTSSQGNERPWTVFPLCHCFPANEPDNFTWVPATKAHVPRTCHLLDEALRCCDGGNDDRSSNQSSYLRTALFSQLDPGSVLEEHTGWADLANHVLRLHIPLVIPNNDIDNNDDLCGTWVDGCVQTHAVGRPLLFDDSKIHRAFNYSDRNRIVLIVDLVRPKSLPSGTAKSGHTEELDAFIEQMNIPK